MIHWKDCGFAYSKAIREQWRSNVCKWETKKDGACLGVGRSRGDDEPHDICKACDKLRGDAE